MHRKKTSKKQEFSLKDMSAIEVKKLTGLSKFNAKKYLDKKEWLAKALWQCLVEGDIGSFKDIIRDSIEVINKDKLAEETGISRRTLYRMLSPEGNPTIDNVSKIINKLCA